MKTYSLILRKGVVGAMTGLLGIIAIIVVIGIVEWYQQVRAEIKASVMRMQQPQRNKRNRG